MTKETYLKCTWQAEGEEAGVVRIVLNRPEVHNAFNDDMIEEITSVFQDLQKGILQGRPISPVRLVVLSGEGSSFCAGADLNWMKKMKDYTWEENVQDSLKLSKMFQTINAFPWPVLAKVHGAALGGGVGLLAVCDYVVAVKDASLGFTETRLGLVPAVISPFVMAKIGAGLARAYFLSGERFSAERAQSLNLVHELAENTSELEQKMQKVLQSFLAAGPFAQVLAKSLIAHVEASSSKDLDLYQYTAQVIAKARTGEEGQTGMEALLTKQRPPWVNRQSRKEKEQK